MVTYNLKSDFDISWKNQACTMYTKELYRDGSACEKFNYDSRDSDLFCNISTPAEYIQPVLFPSGYSRSLRNSLRKRARVLSQSSATT